jgi:hypothetical protein
LDDKIKRLEERIDKRIITLENTIEQMKMDLNDQKKLITDINARDHAKALSRSILDRLSGTNRGKGQK